MSVSQVQRGRIFKAGELYIHTNEGVSRPGSIRRILWDITIESERRMTRNKS